jgi:hypothetical protein
MKGMKIDRPAQLLSVSQFQVSQKGGEGISSRMANDDYLQKKKFLKQVKKKASEREEEQKENLKKLNTY